MKKLLAGSCVMVFALLSGAVAQAQTFKGLYIGGNLGGGNGSSNAATTTVFSPTGYFAMSSVPAIATAGAQKPSSNGFNGGGTAGYNWQSGPLVIGFEVDFGGMHLNGSKSTTATYPCCAPTAFTVLQTVKTSWLFTGRPRVGIAAGHWLLYGTGGFAVTNRNYQALFTDTFATAHENGGVDNSATGWIAGGGAEVRLGGSGHWSLKGEYLYASFGSTTVTSTNLTAFTPPISFPTNVFTHTADLKSSIGRLGINFKF
jgi:outer membrane immunogenic protein